MILSVSQRTDIVAFYSEWFMKQYHKGFWDVRNPYYPKQVSRIYNADVDIIFFCTKNPLPIIDRLDEITQPIVFHVTLTPYKQDVEPSVINKIDIIEGIKALSNKLGSDNVFVRYDPILLNDYYTIDYHIRAFDRVCELLKGYVKHIIVSFIDDYKNVKEHKHSLRIKSFTEDDYKQIGQHFVASASRCGMLVQTCCEERRLLEYGFIKEDCMSKEFAYRLSGKKYCKWKGRNSEYCNCVGFVDIGSYNSCEHFCKYCYANYDEQKVLSNYRKHNEDSSLLIGALVADDVIKERKG
ncbi:DNA repair photolyase [Breznakia sp. PF5-3]|uniref:DUF1848 domain-containing protein n=1 Tax=unclassified Breznakia TaxID=2623764 RepID=UPI002406A83C|nr:MULTISPECIES: DUF1848 domain-containing protein [unclassified Breznakia]MDF9824244.1 DNA repair photolyase [Breznakia sp. PM6-1]MDF9835189.1 DNA repair photolyase [Breznakia sp. PF5-3]MDF9837301.1 DNA repair photolyase [Breznakia sp. PFB2-8]MDF9859436.1 DNA repair photolyase [Breznakia sp. PH5-24]